MSAPLVCLVVFAVSGGVLLWAVQTVLFHQDGAASRRARVTVAVAAVLAVASGVSMFTSTSF